TGLGSGSPLTVAVHVTDVPSGCGLAELGVNVTVNCAISGRAAVTTRHDNNSMRTLTFSFSSGCGTLGNDSMACQLTSQGDARSFERCWLQVRFRSQERASKIENQSLAGVNS